MIRRLLIFAIGAAGAVYADSASPSALTVTFNGGTALEIHTESTLRNSPFSTSGSVSISDRNRVSRTVVDKNDRVLFNYDIEAEVVAGQRYNIRIKPHDPNQISMAYFAFAPGDQLTIGDAAYTVRGDGMIPVRQIGDVQAAGLSPDRLAAILKQRGITAPVKVTTARRETPTVSGIREFKNVKIGEAVSIDILFNPSTGERIFDVIQPLVPGPKMSSPARDVAKLEDEFSLMKIRVAINGKTVQEPDNSWMIGGAIKMSLPGHGTVYLALQPLTSHAFQPVGRADGKRLTFPVGADFVEITGAENVMKKSANRKIWVYWDSAAPNTESVDITCSGTIEALLK
jgi:hypothetical protein